MGLRNQVGIVRPEMGIFDRNPDPALDELVELAAVAGDSAVLHHVADARLLGIESGEQAGAGGAAAGGGVELGHSQASRGHAVQVGGGDF